MSEVIWLCTNVGGGFFLGRYLASLVFKRPDWEAFIICNILNVAIVAMTLIRTA